MLNFIDETGDHNLIKIDPDFPLFGLGAMIISKSEYKKLDIGIKKIKQKYFEKPHTFVLHSAELTRPRKSTSDHRNVAMEDSNIRNQFYNDINNLLTGIKFELIIHFIFKNKLSDEKDLLMDPYHFSFENLLNRILRQKAIENIIMSEGRDKFLNNRLMAEYERMCKVGIHKFPANLVKNKTSLTIHNKKKNINGLQVIDLIMSVLARKFLGKKEKPIGNGISLKLIESKILELNTFPKQKTPPHTQ